MTCSDSILHDDRSLQSRVNCCSELVIYIFALLIISDDFFTESTDYETLKISSFYAHIFDTRHIYYCLIID
jgi:hypothetical protein